MPQSQRSLPTVEQHYTTYSNGRIKHIKITFAEKQHIYKYNNWIIHLS